MFAGQPVEGCAFADLAIVIAKRVRCTREQLFQPVFPVYHRQRHQILAVQEQQIEEEEYQQSFASIAGVLDQIEGRRVYTLTPGLGMEYEPDKRSPEQKRKDHCFDV